MAILKFGSIVTGGSGSLGGHTIQHSKGGMQIRTKPIPRGNPSASQTLIRSINQQLQAGWHQLTSSQQKIWNDWPVTHGIMNAKGDKHPLSGHSLWMKYNYYWLIAGGDFLPDPSFYGGPVLGTELIKNGIFDSEAYWTKDAGWSISGGKANYLDIGEDMVYQSITITNGSSYYISFDISNCPSTGNIIFRKTEWTTLFAAPYNNFQALANGHYSANVIAIDNSNYFAIFGRNDKDSYSIDNLSLRKYL